MPPEIEYSFTRYLTAKKSVDDRALNNQVWDALVKALPPSSLDAPLRVLEIGAGIGTMLERMIDRGLLTYARYYGIDIHPENIAIARQRLSAWSNMFTSNEDSLLVSKESMAIDVRFEAIDLYHYLRRERVKGAWDLLVAHAFLDLIDLPSTLPSLFGLLANPGLVYFTINFDGMSSLEPVIDPEMDKTILRLYHRTMDERVTNEAPSGDSRTGRHLFTYLRGLGAEIIEAGASDWVVYPGKEGYPADEAYFLHFIVHTIHSALMNHPDLDKARFSAWVAERHAQIQRGELVYIAHQLDFVCLYPGS